MIEGECVLVRAKEEGSRGKCYGKYNSIQPRSIRVKGMEIA